jgi:predicted acylesterase/phospholipase RssA
VSYSPHLRTAVLLSGIGTGGAYHAGVLRALHEAGIKIDVMSGRGIGVVCALFAAIAAGVKTW